jgi:hypothetical protein
VTTNIQQIEEVQRRFCEDRGVSYVASPAESKTGFALATKGKLPINGLRHPSGETTSGWFISCGEPFSEESDFFAPLHTYHVYEDYPELAKLLGLTPGHRFLLVGDDLDIWFDPELLGIRECQST